MIIMKFKEYSNKEKLIYKCYIQKTAISIYKMRPYNTTTKYTPVKNVIKASSNSTM